MRSLLFENLKIWVMFLLATSFGVAFAQQDPDVSTLDELIPEMIQINSGTFKMGDMAGEGDANELPVHEVSVHAFSIAKYEVTFDLFDLFANATGRDLPGDEGWGRGNRPVTNVSWHDGVALASWLSEQTGREFRLPTEAEWEFAARAGTDTPFSNGDTVTREYGNYGPNDCCGKGPGKVGRDQWDYTSPVGAFEANPWGLHDTVGNVWEWTADCYNEDYQGAPTDGSAWLTGDCERSPLRGGSWTHYSRNLRPANRNDNAKSSFGNGYGIRLAETM